MLSQHHRGPTGEAAIPLNYSTYQIASVLTRVGWLSGVPTESVAALVSQGMVRSFKRGSYLFQQGDPSEEFFVLLSGKIELTSSTVEGTERLHSILRPGDVFGDAETLTESPRMTVALALEPSEAWRCKRLQFTEFIEAQPTVLRALLADVVRRVQALDDLVQDVTTLPLKARVAKSLLALSLPPDGRPLPRRTASIVGQVTELSLHTSEITQTDLAKLCGGSRENVARALGTLQRRGVIKRTGHAYELLDVPYLRRLARLPYDPD